MNAVVSAARRAANLSRRLFEADQELKRLMAERYEEHDELPDSIVEVVMYGGAGDKVITLAWLDEEMAAVGHPVISPLP